MNQPQSFWSGSPKSMFFMGLFLGLAASSTVALAVVLGMVWNGKTVTAGTTGNAQQVAQAPTQPSDQQPAPTPAKPVNPVSSQDHVRGAKNAKVTMIEYSDFECPFCKRHAPSVDQALKDFPNDVRLVYRHYPLSFHPQAQPAAEASECAAKLGGDSAFWKMHDKIFEKNPDLSAAVFASIAKDIGLNETKFKACVDSHETKGRVDSDFASGNDAGVEGTPATFVNGQLVSGAVPYETFKQALVQAGAKS